jgi:hypothetical protein
LSASLCLWLQFEPLVVSRELVEESCHWRFVWESLPIALSHCVVFGRILPTDLSHCSFSLRLINVSYWHLFVSLRMTLFHSLEHFFWLLCCAPVARLICHVLWPHLLLFRRFSAPSANVQTYAEAYATRKSCNLSLSPVISLVCSVVLPQEICHMETAKWPFWSSVISSALRPAASWMHPTKNAISNHVGRLAFQEFLDY